MADKKAKATHSRGSSYLRTENDKKSKYLRDPNEKKKSKYARDDSVKKSKYLRDNSYEKEHHYNLARNYRELDEPEIDIDAEVEALINPEADSSESSDDSDLSDSFNQNELTEDIKEDDSSHEKKGDDAALFKHSKLSKDTTVAKVASANEKKIKYILKTVIIMFLLTAASCALQFANFKTWVLPSFISIEFSVFPELIASIAYGPVFGIIIVLLKNIFRLLLQSAAYSAALSNFILDSVFVFTVGFIYTKRMFSLKSKKSHKKRDRVKRRRIVIGGLLGTAITTIVSFFLTLSLTIPILIRQYSSAGLNEYYIINNYQQALDRLHRVFPMALSALPTEIEDLMHAVLYYNVPVTFIKFFFVSVVVSIVYVIISPYIHFTKKSK